MAEDKEQRKQWLNYNVVEKGSEQQYPSWLDSRPNLQTYLDAFNLSNPIIGCKFELVWSRWPRTIFFAKDITIPGVSVNTIDINHAGFTVAIPTHVTYENTEITIHIIADKEGFHYYDLRNMVFQTAHPLVAGDPKACVGNQYNVNTNEDILEVRLRNSPEDETHHHWIIHNFHPIAIGDIELSHDSGSFIEFEIRGTFTHITYDCGHGGLKENTPDKDPNKKTPDEIASEQPEEQSEEEPEEEEPEEEEEEYDPDDYYDPLLDPDYDPYEDPFGEDEEPEEDEENPMPKGTTVLNANEAVFTGNTPNGGTISITSSIPSSVKFGEDRDEDPSPEEQELARDTADKLNDAGNELQQKLQEIMNMPSSDDPNDEDKEESWLPSPSDEEKPEKSMFDKIKDWWNGDEEKEEEGSNDFGVIRDSPDDRDTEMITDPDSGSRMAKDDDKDYDSVQGIPQVMVNASPPLSKEQKQAVIKAMKEYNQKVNKIADDFEKRKEELKDESELPDEDEEEQNEEQEENEADEETKAAQEKKNELIDKYPFLGEFDVNTDAIKHYGEETINKKPWLATVDVPGDGDEEVEAAKWWSDQKNARFQDRF